MGQIIEELMIILVLLVFISITLWTVAYVFYYLPKLIMQDRKENKVSRDWFFTQLRLKQLIEYDERLVPLLDKLMDNKASIDDLHLIIVCVDKTEHIEDYEEKASYIVNEMNRGTK